MNAEFNKPKLIYQNSKNSRIYIRMQSNGTLLRKIKVIFKELKPNLSAKHVKTSTLLNEGFNRKSRPKKQK
jgi:hypothetical protein